MTIAAILSNKGHEVVTVPIDQLVGEAARVLAGRRIGAVPVMEGQTVVGVFSERDVLYCLSERGSDAMQLRVDEVMTSPAVTVTPAESAIGALALMTRRRIRHLPVVEGEALVGLVSIGDLVKYRIDRVEADAAAMRDYIQSS